MQAQETDVVRAFTRAFGGAKAQNYILPAYFKLSF
jgi:hypothetical protein